MYVNKKNATIFSICFLNHFYLVGDTLPFRFFCDLGCAKQILTLNQILWFSQLHCPLKLFIYIYAHTHTMQPVCYIVLYHITVEEAHLLNSILLIHTTYMQNLFTPESQAMC